jgi:hypothetical protein
MYIAQIGAAGELIVIDVVIDASGSWSSSTSMSRSDDTATPHLPNSPAASAGVGVVAVQRRHVERHRQPRLAVVEQVAEALVRLLRGAEAREHAHRPRLPAIARRVDATRVRILARRSHRARIDARVAGVVHALDRPARCRHEGAVA